MQKFLLILLSLVALASHAADETVNPHNAVAGSGNAPDADIGYYFGYSLGINLRQGGITDVDVEALLRGFSDGSKGQQPALSQQQQRQIVDTISQRQQAWQESERLRVRKDGDDYLAANAKQADVTTTASGLQYRVMTEGKGETPSELDTVTVHYRGRFIDGKEFDSSYKGDEAANRGEKPAKFGVTQVIAGWTEGLQLMKVGGKMEFTVPFDLAYGPAGSRSIPPMSVLVFEVELLAIESGS